MTPNRLLQAMALTLSLQPLAGLSAAPLQLTEESRESLSLTLYQRNLALVEETRTTPALPSASPITLTGVSSQMLPETLQVIGAGTILEQNLESNTLDLNRLLQQQIGQEIRLMRFNSATGDEQARSVRLLRAQGNMLMVENGEGRIETLTLHDGQWRLLLDSPGQFQLKPSLSFQTQGTDKPGQAQLRYLTRGISWSMDYVLNLEADSKHLNLQGLATLSNDSDMDWPDARIKLLAGEVNEPQQAFRMESKALAMSARADSSGGASPSSVQDYHLYSLERSLSLQAQQQKQIPLISQQQLPTQIEYHQQIQVATHQQQPVEGLKPDIKLSFEAPAVAQGRTPLPAGQVRVFRPDEQGQQQFIGGSHMPATAPGDRAEITLGKAFDLESEYRQTSFTKLFDGYETSYTLTLSNRSEESKPFVVTALMPRPFELIKADAAPAETNASNLKWTLNLKAGETRELSFSVKLLRI